MLKGIFTFITGFVHLALIALVLVGGFFIFLGFHSFKGILANIKRDGFMGARQGRRDGYRERDNYRPRERERARTRERDRESYRRREMSRDLYDDYDYAEEIYEKTPSFNLNIGGSKFLKQFKTREQFEDYIKDVVGTTETPKTKDYDYIVSDKPTEEVVKSCVEGVMDKYKAELCTKEDLAKCVKSIQREDFVNKTKEENFKILEKGNREEDRDLYMVVQGKDFTIKELLGTKTADEFVKSQKDLSKMLGEKSYITNVSVVKIGELSDIYICKFHYVDTIYESPEVLAGKVVEGTPYEPLTKTIVVNEMKSRDKVSKVNKETRVPKKSEDSELKDVKLDRIKGKIVEEDDDIEDENDSNSDDSSFKLGRI